MVFLHLGSRKTSRAPKRVAPGGVPAPHTAGAGTLCLAEAAEGTAIFAQRLGDNICIYIYIYILYMYIYIYTKTL